MNEVCTTDMLTDAWFSGVWHGGLAALCFIFAIIGWPATRFVLGTLFSPFTKKPARVPVGSKFWDNYGQKKWNPDFAIDEASPYKVRK